jgi:hypothetical protein
MLRLFTHLCTCLCGCWVWVLGVGVGCGCGWVGVQSGVAEDIAAQAREGLDLMLKTHQKFYEGTSRFLAADWEVCPRV